MKKQVGIMTVLFILMFSCTTKENSNEASASSSEIDSLRSADKVSAEIKESVGNSFDKDKDFEVLSSTRGITKQSFAQDTIMCKGWTIATENIIEIIKGSEPLGGPDLHHLFDVLPCIIKGQIIQDGMTYGYEMNAGAWIYISSKDTTLILGSFKEKNERYFVSNPMKGE